MASTRHLYLDGDSGARKAFGASFDRRPFEFTHQLDRSGYFTFDALLNLAARVSRKPNRWYFEEGDTQPASGWSTQARKKSLLENLQEIGHSHSLVMLKRVDEEPEYQEILKTLEAELADLTGIDIPARYRDGLMTVLITSPGRVTPYHIDGEANLLMQMSGTKSVYIFDGNNREVLTTHELEAFWSGNIKAPAYKEHLQDRAWHYLLAPGRGVSNPVIFPHWVKNGPEVSISLSVNFKRRVDNSADAYRVNRQLRRLGMQPLEPGNAKIIDCAKGVAYRTARRVKQGWASLSSKSA
jgi:hypothetical protein